MSSAEERDVPKLGGLPDALPSAREKPGLGLSDVGTSAGAPTTATDESADFIEPEHGVLTFKSKAAGNRDSTNNIASQKDKMQTNER
jgi:hypothetical protein